MRGRRRRPDYQQTTSEGVAHVLKDSDLASHGVSGVHSGRRLRDDRDAGRCGRPDDFDPTTFRVLPWAPTTGWVLCDVHFADGRPVPFATRGLYKSVLGKLSARGYDFKAGLEVEFHVFKVNDPKMQPADAGSPASRRMSACCHTAISI